LTCIVLTYCSKKEDCSRYYSRYLSAYFETFTVKHLVDLVAAAPGHNDAETNTPCCCSGCWVTCDERVPSFSSSVRMLVCFLVVLSPRSDPLFPSFFSHLAQRIRRRPPNLRSGAHLRVVGTWSECGSYQISHSLSLLTTQMVIIRYIDASLVFSFTTLLVSLLSIPSLVSATCYWQNSTLAPDSPFSIAPDDTACFPAQANSPCCGTGWSCLSNGVCFIEQSGNPFYYRGDYNFSAVRA
jgi:hypothetical protein